MIKDDSPAGMLVTQEREVLGQSDLEALSIGVVDHGWGWLMGSHG
jgi:hypothetical protein